MKHFAQHAGIDAPAPPSADAIAEIDFVWGVKIPMRDGVHLNGTLYKSKHAAPLPVSFTMTPYISDSYHPRGFYFAQHGYAFVLVDCRGRGNSEGKFDPFMWDEQDTYDVVEWLATQDWCDGSVTMWGGSYAGFNQWMALKANPPHLKTIVPAAAAYVAVDFPFQKNIWGPYELQWLTFTSGVTGNGNLFAEDAFWIAKFRDLYLNHRPFRELDQIVGNVSTMFQTRIAHPIPDAYWDTLALTPADYDRITMPILTITGHYDADQFGAMHYYHEHMKSASPARDQHYLIMGPWDHAGTRTPKAEFGGLKFAEASLVDLNELHVEWYDWTMKGGAKPDFLKARVAYYLAGAETWKYADSLEAIADETRRLYLTSDGSAGDVFHSGSLSETAPGAQPPDSYVYDPLDTRRAALEETSPFETWYVDQRYALHTDGDGLIYHSAPFTEATEITGYVRLALWLALDVPDTDFQVSLYEILRDGSGILLTQDLMRARYRESLREEKLVEPGVVNEYVFDGFSFFSRQVAKGSRLRLFITAPNSIYFQKNYNSGGAVMDESGADARTAHVVVYHDAEHPSALDLPIVHG